MGKSRLAGLVLASTLGLGAVAVAWAGPGGPGPRGAMGEEMLFRMLDRLDLSPEQRATVEGIVDSYRPRMKALREAVRENRKSLANSSPDDADYASVVAEASQAAATNAGELVNLSAALRGEVHAVLTEEQRAEARQLREEFRERVKQRRQDRRRRWLEDNDGSGI